MDRDVLIALLSLVATVTIPLMTKAVIDGPVRHQDQQQPVGARRRRDGGAGVSEAVLWFIRRWLVARATMGVEADIRKDLYARLQILPMSFHGSWQSGQLLSRVMNDLSTIRQFLSFGLLFLLLNVIQIIVVTGILLAMYWPLGVVVVRVDRADHRDRAALPAAVHQVVPRGAGPVRQRRHPRRGAGARVCGWSRRSAARSTPTNGSTSAPPTCSTPR